MAQTASGPCAVWSYCLLSPRMSAGAPGYWHVYKTASLENYWFVYFTACIRSHLTRWTAGAESNWHAYVASPSPSNQDPRSVPLLTGLCSRVWLPEGWDSPGDQRWENECRGDQHALGACWALRFFFACFMWEMLCVLGPAGCRGSRGERCGEGVSLWDCCDVVGIVRECWCIDLFIVLRAVWRVRCSYSAAALLCESAQLDTLWIDKCRLWSDRRIRLNG